MSDTIIDAGHVQQVPVTRRAAIRTGGLAALAASLLGTVAPASAAFAEPTPLPVTADVPLIDQAEVMLVELQRIMLQLDPRNRTNLGANLEHIARLAEVREDLIPETLADYPLEIGEGNRVCDRMDRMEAIEAEALTRIEAVYSNLPRIPVDANFYEHAKPVIDRVMADLATIEADLIARHGEDGGTAYRQELSIYLNRMERERKERQVPA
jgi:hypothetical protein